MKKYLILAMLICGNIFGENSKEVDNCIITIKYHQKNGEILEKKIRSHTTDQAECKKRVKNHKTNFAPYETLKKEVSFEWVNDDK